jgi:hypothetical protein
MRTTSGWQVMTYYARVVAHGVIIVRSIATMRTPTMSRVSVIIVRVVGRATLTIARDVVVFIPRTRACTISRIGVSIGARVAMRTMVLIVMSATSIMLEGVLIVVRVVGVLNLSTNTLTSLTLYSMVRIRINYTLV